MGVVVGVFFFINIFYRVGVELELDWVFGGGFDKEVS